MATHSHHVLLVGSNGETAALEQTLGSDGWQVIRADAVADAMECAKRVQPSAVVFRGALADGVNLVKKLRCNARAGASRRCLLPRLPTRSSPMSCVNSCRFRR